MKKYVLLLMLVVSVTSKAQNYDVKFIPDSLLKNADAITRVEELKLTIFSTSSARITHKWAVTVLNEAGARFAGYSNSYSSMQELSNISGDLYDANGAKLKSVKRKDIADMSMEDGFSLMQDARIKQHNFYYAQYPYTIQYEDEVNLKGIIGLPTWSPVEGQRYAVQSSSFIIEAPLDYKFRYKELNYEGKPVITNNKLAMYQWNVSNFKPFIREPYQPYYREIIPMVYTAPNKFVYGKVEGDMSTWLSYGKYQVELNKGRDELPENIKQEVHRIADVQTTKTEKIKALYNYLQANTRYISIQLGIGGLQPFDAKYVATNRYGDCKALSNYMKALLKEAGIESFYSIIHAGEGEKYYLPDFVSDQTNHIIVSVPMEKDTMWLECTNQTIAAGYLGSFTDDRYALLIKDDGGHLVKTPAYAKKQNVVCRKVEAEIVAGGQLMARVENTYTGLEQDDLHGMLNAYTPDELLKYLKKSIDLPTYDVAKVNYNEQKDRIPTISEKYELSAPNYASATGRRLFVQPNVLSREAFKLSDVEDRKFDIIYDFSFSHLDTTTIKIPAGYAVEAMPKNVTIKNKFGEYEMAITFQNGTITFLRRYERSSNRFKPSEYKDMAAFYNEMYKADHAKVVFVKNEG
ncbi:MAG: DUF3857 domain-containing protein [Chitinophagaceae bacterium]|nr:DUF3857 domain-containing protein [Chitinophagaceae bacterium]